MIRLSELKSNNIRYVNLKLECTSFKQTHAAILSKCLHVLLRKYDLYDQNICQLIVSYLLYDDIYDYCIQNACLNGDLNMVKILVDFCKINVQSEDACGAAVKGHLSIVKYLVEEHCVDMSSRDFAAYWGYPRYVYI